MHKLGVIVPYRNRYEHLIEFKTHIVQYLKSTTDIVLAIKNIKPLKIIENTIQESSKTHLVKSKRHKKNNNKSKSQSLWAKI
mgnify:CR=1 FL=1